MLNSKGFYYTKNSIKEKKQVKKKLKLQKKVFGSCDIVIPNSITQIKLLKENYPSLEYFYCPNGQDFSLFNLKKDIIYDRNTVLFYGSMGGEQNIGAFKLFYKNVWPLILKENKLAKLLIVGNKPPNWIKILGKKENITVTGFVEDPISIILRACCMVLPMDIGVGFRGRIVEAMIAGVPIVGNHNALDCIRMENKIHGYITDDYSLMAEYALKMMRDDSLRNEISGNAYQFVQDNYSIEATFKKLSTFLMLKLKQL